MYHYVYERMLYLNSFQAALSKAATDRYMKSMIVYTITMFIFVIMLTVVAKPGAIMAAVMTVIIPAATVIMKLRHLNGQISRRKTAITLELPVFLNKLLLLINAGESIQRAIARCAEQYTQENDSPLAGQLRIVAAQLNNQYPLPQVFDEFSRRCGVHEAAVLASAIMLNYRRGGTDFVASLRQLSVQLWQKRKAAFRKLGEEASAKLVFPLVVIFALLTALIASPAILMLR